MEPRQQSLADGPRLPVAACRESRRHCWLSSELRPPGRTGNAALVTSSLACGLSACAGTIAIWLPGLIVLIGQGLLAIYLSFLRNREQERQIRGTFPALPCSSRHMLLCREKEGRQTLACLY